ncbi:MAG: alpha/beta fold hydrolase [bacterium]|nr:alpha/beta fold hydrolase [bacterium]
MRISKSASLAIIVLIAALGLIGWRLLSPAAEPNTLTTDAVTQTEVAGESKEAVIDTLPLEEGGGPSYHPISIQALAELELTGRDLTLGQVLDDNSAYTRYYVTYKSGDLTISGIMNIPKGDGPFPVLVLNHGHIDTSVYTNGRGLKREQDYFASRGFAVIHPDYRNHAQSDKDPEEDYHFRFGYTEDVMNAVHAVKNSDLASLDAGRMGMLGHSMGGGITLNIMAAKPDLVDAYVLYAPVSADVRDNYERWTARRPEHVREIEARYGSPAESPEFWDGVSPWNYLDMISRPVLLQHGTADESVPYEWSERLYDTLVQKEKDITFHAYAGGPHEFVSDWPLFMQRNVEFFQRHLQ